MKAASVEERWLIADIGGTNSRLAICHKSAQSRNALHGLRKLENAAYVQIDDMLGAFVDALDDLKPSHAVLAIAGPVTGDRVRLLNIDWSFSIRELRQSLGLTELIVINDFEALAHVVPVLRNDEYLQVGGGAAERGAPAVLIGPGTGLGVASIVPFGERHIAIPGEGGHSSLPASNAEEARLTDIVRQRHGHCSAERLLSGNGLATLHDAMHGETLDAATISQRANAGERKATQTFQQFFLFLGAVAGDAALMMGAHGGVYLGGGIIPGNLKLFRASGFRQRFVDKGRYRDYLEAIPTRVITAQTPALIGLSSLIATL